MHRRTSKHPPVEPKHPAVHSRNHHLKPKHRRAAARQRSGHRLIGWLALAAIAGVAACGDDPAPSEPQITATAPPDSSWLLDVAIPFDTDDPYADYTDLMPLKEIIGDARVVALGEQTHGIIEFERMKHRLLRFLVLEMGFNAFGMEATWGESNRVGDYVRTGAGDPRELLSGLYFWQWTRLGEDGNPEYLYFWNWHTQSVLEMIEWMRAHNEDPGSAPTVSFHGIDLQRYRLAMEDVDAYIVRVDPDASTFVANAYACYRAFWDPPNFGKRSVYALAPDTLKAACRSGVRAVHDTIAARRADYEAASSPLEYTLALRTARIVVQNEDMMSSGHQDELLRSEYMAENAAWILEHAGPDGKLVIWTDNAQLKEAPGTMGRHLRERFGADLVTIGFAFGEGRFRAFRVDTIPWSGVEYLHLISPPPAGSYEKYFFRSGLPRFILDLRTVDDAPAAVADWMRGPQPFQEITCCYDTYRDYTYEASLPDEFDVIVYFRRSTPTSFLPLQ